MNFVYTNRVGYTRYQGYGSIVFAFKSKLPIKMWGIRQSEVNCYSPKVKQVMLRMKLFFNSVAPTLKKNKWFIKRPSKNDIYTLPSLNCEHLVTIFKKHSPNMNTIISIVRREKTNLNDQTNKWKINWISPTHKFVIVNIDI